MVRSSTTSTPSNHLQTTSTEVVKSDHLHHLHHLPRGRWWVEAVKRANPETPKAQPPPSQQTSAHPNPLALSATMSGMTWAAITAGHWGFFGGGVAFASLVGALALGLAAAAKREPHDQAGGQ